MMQEYTGRACYISGVQQLSVEPITVPVTDDKVLVKMTRGGICGSDIHYYYHGGVGDLPLQHPMILGHEVAGKVVNAPVNSKLTPGQKVVINPSLPCEKCRYCLEGHENHCSDMRFWGSAMRNPHIHGGFSDYLSVDVKRCIAYNPEIDDKVMVFAEPLAVAIHSVNLAGGLIGKHVLVSGAGPIGCLIIAVAKACGAESVTAFDISDKSCQLALSMGADIAINSSDRKNVAHFRANKGYFDVAFDASGVPAAIQLMIQITRPTGTLIQVGNSRGFTEIPLMDIVAKELTLKGSFRFGKEFLSAVNWLENGRIDPLPLLSAEINIDNAEAAILLAADKTQSAKVQLTFD